MLVTIDRSDITNIKIDVNCSSEW